VRLYGRGPLYDFRALRRAGLLVHAPGEILLASEGEHSVAFTIRAWPRDDYFVLVNGVPKAPTVKVNGIVATNLLDAGVGRLILKLSGQPRVQIDW
jgi:hypothetical protein